MKKLAYLAIAASMTGVTAPANAAFYFEGLAPYTDAPNCNDPYATTCGRYGHVPHYDGAAHQGAGSDKSQEKAGETRIYTSDPAVRYHTRQGLEK